MKKHILYSVLTLGLIANLFVGAQIYLTSAEAAESNDPYRHVELFTRVLEKVRQEYVDPEKVSYEDLIRAALKGMLDNLDPHSEFMEPRKYEDLKSDTEGAYGGLGIVVNMRDGILTVLAPMEDSPAFKAGVLPGDRIVRINGEGTEKMSIEDAVSRLKGRPGTQVTITVARTTEPETKDYTLTRAIIKVDTVKDINGRRGFPVSEDKIGYVRITQFGEHTSSELESALKKLKGNGAEAFIIDLRNNPGGLLDQAVKVCELFVPRGQLVVSTEGPRPQARFEYVSKSRDQFPGMPIVILVNGYSASASEIVSGCLQDVGRAFVVGEQTFGKGSVQSIIQLQDGYAVKLTTAKYYTPSHKVIHEKGITPDSVVPMPPGEEEILFLKRVPGGIESLPPELRERAAKLRDVQFERAVDFLKGYRLYQDRQDHARKVAANG